MAPWKCPDCGIWWAGLEHRCRQAQTGTGGIAWIPPSGWPDTTTTVRCTCWMKTSAPAVVICPIHDVQLTYTKA